MEMMQPQPLQIKLSRFDAQPWGFRLKGGVDLHTPLLVQKVNAGSLAAKGGLLPGDVVLFINDVDAFNLPHKDAQEMIVRSGNSFMITIQRGDSTWRPHVTPTSPIPHRNQLPYFKTLTKTSLAHHQPESQHIGCGYNNSARPFANQGDGSPKSFIKKQNNTPVGIFSDESIAETLSAQAEVLDGGVLGVNFKKNEKEYQADRSEVLKVLREEESGHSTPDRYQKCHEPQHQHYLHQQQGQNQSNPSQQQQLVTRHASASHSMKPPSSSRIPTGQHVCSGCEQPITGVFVRINDRNYHAECFKCASCGMSLKNRGYYNVNNTLLCSTHGAQQNPNTGTEAYIAVQNKSLQ